MAYDSDHIINLGQLKTALETVSGKIADEKVKQNLTSENATFKVLLTPKNQSATSTSESYFNDNLKYNAYTGKLSATRLEGDGTEINVGSSSNNAVYTTTGGKLTSSSFAVASPSTGSSPTLEFITSISQDSKGQISATKESVKDMSGSNGSAAGAHGLVPAPASSDNVKYLKGDGTWSIPDNTDTKVNVVLDTTEKAYLLGTSTTPTSSAQAVTSVADTGVYLDTTAGHLTATQFNGSGAGINVGSTSSYAVVTTTNGKLTSESHSVTSPSTGTSPALEFIATVSQNSKGKISATKQTVKDMGGADGTNAGTHGLVPAPAATDNVKFLTGAGTWTAETSLSKGTTSGSGNAVTDISVSGHQITLTKGTTFATKAELEALGNPMNFKGTVGTGGTVTTLPSDAKVGDTYKVITAGTYGGESCKIGDTIICTVAGASQTWVVIPSGDEPSGTVTNVSTGTGLSGGPITSSGTISHADTSTATSMTTGGRTYVNSLTIDGMGHVTAIGTGTETVTNTDTKVKQTSDTSTDSNFPILFSSTSSPTSGTAYEAKYNSNVNINAKSGTVTATGFSGPLTGNASSATEFSANKSVELTGDVTGSASSKAGWSIETTLANSGVTAGSYGPTADVTGTDGTTIKVPYITVDSKGRVTSISEKTLTNSDKNTTYSPAKLGFGYGECTTAGSTAAKTVSISSYALVVNGIVAVKFAETISVSNSTLNINSKGAKAIYFNGSALAANVITSGNIATFIYDGTHYDLISIDGKDLVGGTFGPTADVTGTDGTTINVPQITVDNFGRVTSVTERILTNKNTTYTVGNKALKVASNTGTATQAITVNENSSDRTLTVKGDGTYLSGAVSGSANSVTVTFTPSDSGATAGTYGPTQTAATTLAYGGTFNVPKVTVDAKGRTTAAGEITFTLPSAYSLPTASSTELGGVKVGTTLEISGGVLDQASGVITAGSVGPTADVTGTEGTTIAVPNITVDTYGRVTALSSYTLTNKNTTYSPQALGFGYGTCSTAAATAAKTATLSGYKLVVNGIVAVKFSNDVPASATLNINSRGAKAIYYNGAAITAGVIKAGDLATFVYSDSKYHVISVNSYALATDSEFTEMLNEIFPV